MNDIILAPDVYVNASVSIGTPPQQVAERVLSATPKAKTTEWVLARVEAMLSNVPAFKPENVAAQMGTIRALVEVVSLSDDASGIDEWATALAASAKAAGATRVVTDHPDLADQDDVDGIAFMSSDAWLVEQTTPPPPPGA